MKLPTFVLILAWLFAATASAQAHRTLLGATGNRTRANFG
jgi:hypothetical protein